MTNKFFTADLHLGHQRVLNTAIREDGSEQRPLMRPDGVTPLRHFTAVEEMNEALVEAWNAVVTPDDKVYVLGDVALSKRHLIHLGRLNGKKTLVGGNHDTIGIKAYLPYFRDIIGVKEMVDERLVLTHVPIHPACVDRFGTNVHGHLHAEHIPDDPRYLCVSVEQTNYAPISLDEVLDIIKDRHG